jgi:putative membrane protein (TIGR04086 family)
MNYSRKKLPTRTETESLSFLGLTKNVLIFFLVFVGISIVFTLLASIVFYNLPNPTAFVDLVATASLFISSLISAFLLSKKIKEKYLLGGLFLGLIITIIIFIGSLFTDTKILSFEFLIKLLIPVFTLLGAFLGIKRERKNKHKRHR